MKIVQLIVGEEFGGSSVIALQIAERFKATLICNPEKQLLSEAGRLGIEAISCPDFVRQIDPLKDLRALWFCYKTVREIKPDILHAHCVKAGLFAALLGPVLGIKAKVVTIHGWPFREISGIKAMILKAMLRLAGPFIDRLVCVCEHDQELARREKLISADKTKVIYNGINPPEVKAVNLAGSRPFNITFIGRLSGSKDPYVLLRALAELKDLDLRAAIIGGGEELVGLKRFLTAHDLLERVELAGELPHKETLDRLAHSHLMVLTSKREGLPVSILEALALGIPAIATRVGGIPEEIEEGVNGFLIEPNDYKQLAGRIKLLYGDEALRSRLGIKGREIFEKRFTAEKMLKGYQLLFDTF